jgi:hypothetical protein
VVVCATTVHCYHCLRVEGCTSLRLVYRVSYPALLRDFWTGVQNAALSLLVEGCTLDSETCAVSYAALFPAFWTGVQNAALSLLVVGLIGL